MARFEREARTLAALNHPHIAAIYGLEDSAGVRAIAIELRGTQVPAPLLTLSMEGTMEISRDGSRLVSVG